MSQLIKKFIANNAVDGTKIRLNNNENLKARNAANSADVNIVKVNASDRIEFASLPQVTSDAVSANDLVRYSQFAGALDGLKPKAAVRVASTGPGVLATDFENGDTVDGVVLATGDRILIWQQASAAQNGIYIVAASGAPARSSDFDAPSEIPGAYTVAEFGTAYQGVLFVSLSSPGTIGVDPINFAMRSISAGANQSLSNLTSPTAINQDLIFDTGDPAFLKTKDDATGVTQNLTVTSGDGTGFASGSLTLSTGISDTASTGTISMSSGSPSAADINSGTVDLSSGTVSGTGNSGGMSMFSGQAVDGGSGAVVVSSGNVSGVGNTGDSLLRTGTLNGTVGVSGNARIFSGASFGSASGNVEINSGNGLGTNSASGNLTVASGSSLGTGVSGTIVLTTGTSVDGNAGDTLLATGSATGTADAGNIILQPGVNQSSVSGLIQLRNGSQGTAGQVWTSTDTNGSGSWASLPAASINNKELFVLSGTDITNQYVDLAHVAKTNSIHFAVKGAPSVIEGASYDYSVSYTGGAGGNTRITFLNDLATGGASALVATDVVVAQYQY